MYAEVHVNIGAAYLKEKNMEMAKHHFEESLRYRQVGTAHVNLAVLALQEASKTFNRSEGLAALSKAKAHCEKALALNDTQQSKAAAQRLLQDIDTMIRRSS